MSDGEHAHQVHYSPPLMHYSDTVTSPTLSRRTLALQLKRLRINAGINVHIAAAYVGVNRTTVQRWERGEVAPKIAAIRSLCDLYQAPTSAFARLSALSNSAGERGIWEAANVPRELRALYESEPTAARIIDVETDLIPGLAQIPEYVRAIQEVQPIVTSLEERESIERVWKQRQDMVFGGDIPKIHLVMGESAINYLRHRPDLMKRQVERLRELDAIPQVSIRILIGLHASIGNSFIMITPDDGPPFVVLESLDGFRYEERRDVVSQYTQIWTQTCATSIRLEEYLHDTWQVA